MKKRKPVLVAAVALSMLVVALPALAQRTGDTKGHPCSDLAGVQFNLVEEILQDPDGENGQLPAVKSGDWTGRLIVRLLGEPCAPDKGYYTSEIKIFAKAYDNPQAALNDDANDSRSVTFYKDHFDPAGDQESAEYNFRLGLRNVHRDYEPETVCVSTSAVFQGRVVDSSPDEGWQCGLSSESSGGRTFNGRTFNAGSNG